MGRRRRRSTPYYEPPKVSNASVKEKPRSVAETIGMGPERVWYPIGMKFKGYEVSNDGYIRSCKLFYNEGGCLIRPNKKTGKYSLVDANGKTYELTVNEVWYLAKGNPYSIPRKTNEVSSAGRNKRVFQSKEVKTPPKPNATYVELRNYSIEQQSMPTFTVIPDTVDPKLYDLTFQSTEYVNRYGVCPIYDLTGEEYYGRQ